MADEAIITDFTQKIIDAFGGKFVGYTIGDYNDVEDKINTPAIFIQLANFDKPDNRVPGKFIIDCTFRAYVCESFKGRAKRKVRQTALDVADFIDGNCWNNENAFYKARFSYGTEDECNEKIESAEVWLVEWQQLVVVK